VANGEHSDADMAFVGDVFPFIFFELQELWDVHQAEEFWCFLCDVSF